jgi:hypothetical protein
MERTIDLLAVVGAVLLACSCAADPMPGPGGGLDSGGPGFDAGPRIGGDGSTRTDAGGRADAGSARDGGAPDDGASGSDGGGGSGTGESCADPIRLTLSGGMVSVSGTTVGAMHDHDGPSLCTNCRSALDVVYAVDVPAGTRVFGNYTAASGTDCLSVMDACPSDMPGGFTCGDASTTLTNPSAGREFAAAGTAYVFVWADGEKSFDLEVTTEAL